MRNTFFCTLVVLPVLGIGSDLAQAQTGRDSRPDWTGFYTLATNRELAGAGLKQDAPGEELNDLIIPHLQPWAKARMEATDGVADDTGQVCLPDGIFRYPSMAGRFIWLQERGRIVMVFQNINTAGVKRIYLDRPHPKNPIPSWNGDSIGRWEGDTLIVDRGNFTDEVWLDQESHPHTDKLHVIERYRRPDLGHLEAEITVEDPGVLARPWTFKRVSDLAPKEQLREFICDENNSDLPHLVSK